MKSNFILSSAVLVALYCSSGFAQVDLDYSSKNLTGSCDSTCAISPKKTPTNNGFQQKLTNCSTGYTRNKIEYSRQDKNGNWTTWEVQQDNCNGAPTYENSTTACPAGQKGTVQTRRDWSCPTTKTGQWIIIV